ncbi:Choline monooxygenase, chloroplastic [Capsicum chinense]|nr:Choline monooxygenase, chloroplastic [Capsicum chinense]
MVNKKKMKKMRKMKMRMKQKIMRTEFNVSATCCIRYSLELLVKSRDHRVQNYGNVLTTGLVKKLLTLPFLGSYTEQIKEPRQYFTGRLGNVEYVLCRDDGGKVHAFHNVCRHHASLLASGSGKSSCFVCPYHGWTYGLDGALLKATRITGIKNFKVNEMGLVPMRVAIWGPFILLNFDNGVFPEQESAFDLAGNEWLGSSSQILADGGVDSSLSFVFCDNYLDGGYHVPYAHKGLASGLTLDSYSTTVSFWVMTNLPPLSIFTALANGVPKLDHNHGHLHHHHPFYLVFEPELPIILNRLVHVHWIFVMKPAIYVVLLNWDESEKNTLLACSMLYQGLAYVILPSTLLVEIACRYPFSFAYVSVLRKAKIVKAKFEALDKSNVANRKLLVTYAKGIVVDRTRMNMTNGLKLEEAGGYNGK